MALKVKSGVQPRILVMAAALANAAGDRTVTITAGSDGRHMVGSKHYTLAALDVRSKSFPSKVAKQAFMRDVLARLGDGYQMLLEAEGKAHEHFHLEWDPS